LLITAYKDDHVYSEALSIGVSEFIEKPFTVDALAESLASLIKNVSQKEVKHS
jgi:YesN/AraC family two-component response regulator